MASRTDVVHGSGDDGSQPTLPAPPRVAGPGLKLRTEDEVVFAELLSKRARCSSRPPTLRCA
ncbi:hypothetical protein EMIHUDRAFT_355456 [Emiliania huxleyi CCMP1516]|uniref:Uncharacterized protein n=2 Tax=Emiliania huxleyi TaxID=2903 RepID=A0A0D3IIS9_EMIH1|nr:hypothetical protein EMIHUDRAFT_357960 [Emiliania huxleyi CCMP1516]XP_005772016.1 hypothetical protein EMIHUDRAFT_355456 [Emiliania huxleyi CCMP1516]EOD11164.1 hypothetical protein EMIHUDRAFT_357960 [Emiliania huxleyi CCMP1516]EOD19587.1 hypothetical protein EMIHUDRAFT_355456 [Emiliania huxleyi CCMP1516]|eukprot:XP_005763593.1 hypothetical protein EMIHUDRAFT_357960 [Emiliania huxleyi CCMP1516]